MMGTNFLDTIGLRRLSTLQVPMSKQAFASKLQQAADKGGYGMFDGFSSNGKFLKGTVTFDSFELSRKRSLGYNGGMYGVVFNGTFSQKGDSTYIEIETRIKWIMMLFFLFPIFFVFPFIVDHKTDSHFGNFEFLFVLIPMLIVVPIWYLSFRHLVAAGEYMIQRELYFLSKKDDVSSRLSDHLINE